MNNFVELVAKIPNWPFTIIAAIIALGGGIYLFRLKRFSDASGIFQEAFAPEISALENPARTASVRDILVSAFARHGEAATNFKWLLSNSSKSRFDQAWQQYHSGHCFDAEGFGIDPKERLFLEYFSFNSQSEAATHALKQIHNLLQFAK